MNIDIPESVIADAVAQAIKGHVSVVRTGTTPFGSAISAAVQDVAPHLQLRIAQAIKAWADGEGFASEIRKAFRGAALDEAQRLARKAVRAEVNAKEAGDGN